MSYKPRESEGLNLQQLVRELGDNPVSGGQSAFSENIVKALWNLKRSLDSVNAGATPSTPSPAAYAGIYQIGMNFDIEAGYENLLFCRNTGTHTINIPEDCGLAINSFVDIIAAVDSVIIRADAAVSVNGVSPLIDRDVATLAGGQFCRIAKDFNNSFIVSYL